MKIFLLLLLLLGAAHSLNALTQDQLQSELAANRKLWLVYRSSNPSLISGSQNGEIERVARLLRGFF